MKPIHLFFENFVFSFSLITSKQIFALFTLFSFSISIYSQVQIGQDIDGENSDDRFGSSVVMPSENVVAVGAPFYSNNRGSVRVFYWDNNQWNQRGQKLVGEFSGDGFGGSISMPDQNTIAIGAINNDGNGLQNSGHVRVFSWNGTQWIQKGADIDGEAFADFSGSSVSMPDQNTIAIGAKNNDGNGQDVGHVRIYRWNGTQWIQKGADIDGEASQDESGSAVSMPDSNTVAIGAIFNDGVSGINDGHGAQFRFVP